MKLVAATLALLLAALGAWLGVSGPREPVVDPGSGGAEARGVELAGPAEPRLPGPTRTARAESGHAHAHAPAPPGASPVEDGTDPALCVQDLVFAGLVLDPRATDVDFQRAFAARPRAERVLARHRIRKLFQVGYESRDALRLLVVDAAVLDVLARQMQWLSANLAAEPADPFAALAVASAGAAPEDEVALARRYAGLCDEDLALELDRIERALAAENDRGLDERIALGLHRVRHQAAEF